MSTCHEEVSRKGLAEPCEKVSVGLRLDPFTGDSYPVCAYHARGEMVPLTEVLAACRAETLDEQPHIQVHSVQTPWCPECRGGKCNNCTGWALDAADNLVECGCDHAAR